MTDLVKIINRGIDIETLLAFKQMVHEDHAKADRDPTVVAEWVGGD